MDFPRMAERYLTSRKWDMAELRLTVSLQQMPPAMSWLMGHIQPVCLIQALSPHHTEPRGTVSQKGDALGDEGKGTSISSLEV